MASVMINPPKTPVTEGSTGIAAATVPNICKMPGPPAPFVPTPLPNIGKSGNSPKDYSQDVKIEGNKVAIKGATFKSMGDVASKGLGGGMVSMNCEGATAFVGPGSMDTKIEGKNVQLLSDPMTNNNGPSGSPPNAATMTGVIQAPGGPIIYVHDKQGCSLCGEEHGESGVLAESGASAGAAEALHAAVIASTDPEKSPTMLGVVHCTHHFFAANSGDPKAFVINAMPESWRHLRNNPRPSNKAILTMARAAKGASVQDWAQVVAQGTWAYDRANADRTLPGANPPGQCAGTRVVVLALDCRAIPRSLTEIWYHPTGAEMSSAMAHWQGDGRGRSRFTTDRIFQAGEHVPPCSTCALILPALMCTLKPDCESHISPRAQVR